ncbi:MAG: hypothetical protein ACXWDO_08580 [Bacteroidia bacterium]
MIKTSVLLVFVLIIISCRNDRDKNMRRSGNSIESILDIVIENKDGNIIEFPEIYDSLATVIPDDDNEHLILAEALKKRGFKVINWGRGNYPPRGQRIVMLTLQKEQCYCEVAKIYYYTTSASNFQVAENISCMDSLSYFKNHKN